MANRIAEFSANGTAPRKPNVSRRVVLTKAERDTLRRQTELRRRVAYAVGGIGVGVLTLSVFHCTEAIALLTGSHRALSCLLAIGIDAGMVACELAELIGECRHLKRWSMAYVGLSIALSMCLNAYAFALHASIWWAGGALGFIIPALVFILGRVAGHLTRAI